MKNGIPKNSVFRHREKNILAVHVSIFAIAEITLTDLSLSNKRENNLIFTIEKP